MDMRNLRDVFEKSLRQILFFDVGMESIEQGFEIWMPNAPNVSSGSSGSVQKVTFKTVQKLNCQTYTLTLGLICYLAVNIGREFELFFGRSGSGEYAQSLMKRPAQDIGTED